MVHNLVLEAFVGPRPPGMECRHLDSNKLNNRLYNICWGTKSQNALDHAARVIASNDMAFGGSTLTRQQVIEIKIALQGGAAESGLATIYRVRTRVIRCIGQGKTWAWLKLEDRVPFTA